jgi:MFS transporter, SET family, sugar efflux transporter
MLPALARLPAFLPFALSVFCLGFGASITMPFMALFGVNYVGMTPLRLGLFLSLTAISGVIISTRLARLSDRLPSRLPLVLTCLGAGILSALAYSALPGRAYLGALLIGALLQGTSAAAFPQLFALARQGLSAAPGDLPERALTVLRSVFSLAWVVGPGLGALALSAWGFQGAFRLAASCWLLATLPLLAGSLRVGPLRVGRSRRGHFWTAGGPERVQSQGAPPEAPHLPVAQVLPTPPPRPARALPWVVAAFVFYGMSMIMGMNFLPLLVTKTLGGGSGQVGFLVSFCALLEIPIMLSLVMLRRLPGLATLIKLALALFVVQFALTALAQSLLPLVFAQVLRAAGIAVMAGLGMTYFQQLMPGRFTAATTLFANTSSVGGVLSGVVSGAWAQAFGYRSVFVLCGVLALIAWSVMEFVGRRHADAAPRLPVSPAAE